MRRKPYSYKPLQTKFTIRILRLDPGRENDPLKGELYRTELIDGKGHSPKFEALSYVWGKKTFDREIQTPDGVIPLTRSLSRALCRIRLPDRSRHVWADAVCINQSDPPERGHQVKLMGQLYSTAQHVLVWLGPDVNHQAKRIFSLARNPRQASTPEGVEALKNALKDLTHCEWFSRLWIVQEHMLARSAKCMWGDEEIDFIYLDWRFHDIFSEEAAFMPWMALRLTREDNYRGRGVSIAEVLTSTRGLGCTDERDRVYATLGLPYDTHITPDLIDLLKSLEPDYSCSVRQSLLEHATAFVKCSRTYILLAQVCHRSHLDHRKRDRPSWLPDLSAFTAEEYMPLNVHRCSLKQGSSPTQSDIFREDTGTLQLQGWRTTDRIDVLGPSLEPDAPGSRLEDAATFWKHHVYIYRQGSTDLQYMLYETVFLQALTASEWDVNLAVNWKGLHAAVQSKHNPASTDITTNLAAKMLRSLEKSSTSRKDEVKLNLFKKLQPYWKQRRLVKTAGKIVALAPLATERGDVVASFPQFNQPLVLRPREGYFLFVGMLFVPRASQKYLVGQDYRTFDLR